MADLTCLIRATSGRLAAAKLFEATELDLVGEAWLREQGVDTALAWNLVGPICRHSCKFYTDGSFTYDTLGEQSYCLVLTEEDAETPIDVLAWSIREPEVFGTLLGQAAIAGADTIANPASYCSGPCPLWQTPLRWLQEGCQGGVVLDPENARPLLENAPGILLCESWDHANDLVKAGAVTKAKLVIPKLRRAA